ncbi:MULTISPECIES: glycosyltransferase family 39 protein [unclassified Coleofasciculus]|uniref:glycosyltransferase family 39 protein n=1 Tax=unclassified Coleofasciculus TaxID=2692782 RepID=UPI0018818437|nr:MULTISPECIES: glycosyltransferase family 39 protein [unclassified Coleofasciculus]MBE9125900.1 glycosyltransferase family 39 protein [Coleofasciculus sp. LEGE 07081]MBE9149090.1 glycosyltransferase family 39 protein [Coleofasciculus sp. LEGE 07092]
MTSPTQTVTKATQLRQWIPISLIMLIAATLYLYRIDTESFWIDELTSVTDIQTGRGLPPRNLVRPLYYILLLVWSQVSTTDAWLRGLSVLFALGSVFLVYQLGRRLAGEPEGLISALLLALSPLFINHAQEARMYIMSACLGLGGTLALTHALMTEKSKHPNVASMGGWIGLRLLATLTVPLNVSLLVPDILLIGWRFRNQRPVLFNFGKWLLLFGILWLPCVFSVIKVASPDSSYGQSGHVAGRQAPDLLLLARALKYFTVWPFAVQSNAIAAGFYKVFTGVVAGLIGAALIKNRNSSKLFWVAAWAFLPLAQIFLFSYISISLWIDRYLLFVSPYILILLAAGIMRLWRQWRIMGIVVALAYALAISGGLVRYYTVQDRPNYKGVVQVINRYEQPGDVIIWSMYYAKALAHYYKGSAQKSQRILLSSAGKSEIESWLRDLPPIQSRLWLAFEISEKNSHLLKTALEKRFTIHKHQVFEGRIGADKTMEIFLVTPHSADNPDKGNSAEVK